MESATLFITRFEYWIYGLLAIAALYYIRLYWRGIRGWQSTLFGLEREQARAAITRSLALLFLLLVVGVSVFFTAGLAESTGERAPQVAAPDDLPPVIYGTLAPIAFPSPTATLGVDLASPGDGTPAPTPAPTPIGQAWPPLPLVLDRTGCRNPDATLHSPTDNARLRGTVDITGAANIPDFAFYKFEIASHATGGNWITLSAGDKPVVNGRLGTWDTSVVEPGIYVFRLVVFDRAGLSPLPCVVGVEVLAPVQ